MLSAPARPNARLSSDILDYINPVGFKYTLNHPEIMENQKIHKKGSSKVGVFDRPVFTDREFEDLLGEMSQLKTAPIGGGNENVLMASIEDKIAALREQYEGVTA